MSTLYEDVTRDVCSTMDLSEALSRFYRLTSTLTQVEGMFIGCHLPEKHSVLHLAHVNSLGTPLPIPTLSIPKNLQDYFLSPERPEICCFNSIEEAPHAPVLGPLCGNEKKSYIEIRLRMDGIHVGVLGAYTAGHNDTEDTRMLLRQLSQPLGLAACVALLEKGIHPQMMARPKGLALPAEMLQPDCNEIFIGDSQHIIELRNLAKCLAKLPVPVLVLGETGVGKEVLASYIHRHSPQANGPFVHVNCGGITETLLESEFFGHEKGAFTGAVDQRIGYFEQANGGTIFLDEIGELSNSAQTRLLLVLEQRRIRRVGGRNEIPVHFRLIAATHRDLAQMTREKTFRQDLFFRLNAFPMLIPPLRDRPGDIPLLALHLMHRAAQRLNLPLPEALPRDLVDSLVKHMWPGNVRELSGWAERFLALGAMSSLMNSRTLTYEFPTQFPTEPQQQTEESRDLKRTNGLSDHLRDYYTNVLQRCGGKIEGPNGAASSVGLHPNTLRSQLRKLQIPFGRKANCW